MAFCERRVFTDWRTGVEVSWMNLHHRVKRAVGIGNILPGGGIVKPPAVHEEFVFITAGREGEPFSHKPAAALPIMGRLMGRQSLKSPHT